MTKAPKSSLNSPLNSSLNQDTPNQDTSSRAPRHLPNPWMTSAIEEEEPRQPESDELFVEAFARGLAVIRSFANRQHPLTIAAVSRRAGVSRSAARRLLHTLVTLGYAATAGQSFTLLPKTLLLGSAFLTSDALFELGQPVVHRLAATLGTFCSLHVPQGYESLMICLAYLTQPAEIDAAHPIPGQSAPLYCSASGLLFLSAYGDVDLAVYLEQVKLRSYTYLTQTDAGQLRQRLQQIREHGYVMTDRELAHNLRAISVPVRDRSGRMIAALVSMATPTQASMGELQARLPLLQAAAQEIGGQLSVHL